ncbi:MAG: transposase [Acaryochloridaceae cyanobacterium RL_2_7]|nr:transposase [Acaryochloridaceae cyanobacterium RL_2_7]
MARPFILEIQESEEELKGRLKRTHQASQQEKLQMLWWVKSGQVSEQQEIATRLGRNTSTITRWLQKYRTGGLTALLQRNKAPGATPIMNETVVSALREQLHQPEGFRSYGEIVEWLKAEHGLEVKYGTVYQWVRYRLGAKLKVPRPQSYRQDVEAVETFKKNWVES